ncbi:hypothetical protein FC683_30290, partial [Bacillus cereus]|uniref:Ig-like domain-containing protein n=1 Tax=Bacillus cereus TaxID=1396 RepID=UPI0010BD8553
TPNTTAIAKIGNAEYTGNVDADGKLRIDIEEPYVEGTEITVRLKNEKGKESEPTTIKVQEGWIIPTVNEVTDKDEQVMGTGSIDSAVTVTIKDGKEIGKGTIGKDGKFSIAIPKQKADTQLDVKVVKGKNEGSQTITVKDVTAPDVPKVDSLKETDTKVTGTGEKGAKVSVKAKDGTEIGKGTVGEDGKFTVDITPQPVGTIVSVTLTDAAGNESEPAEVIVGKGLESPTVNDYYTTDAFAKGNASGASKVVIYVDGKPVRTAAVEKDGTYRIYTGDIQALQKEGTVFEVAAINAKG